MKVFFATDHAGYELKNKLLDFVKVELGYETEDMGAYELDSQDDYPDFIHKAAKAVSDNPANSRAIIIGGSGQGEAMVANRYEGVRAAVYYGKPTTMQIDIDGQELGMVASTREHNDANVLSLGARFLTIEEAKSAVRLWLETDFSKDERHVRRIEKIDTLQIL